MNPADPHTIPRRAVPLTDFFSGFDPEVVARAAIRSRTSAYDEAMARLASGGELGLPELLDGAESSGWDGAWLRALGETLALRGLTTEAYATAVPVLRRAADVLGSNRRRRVLTLLAQLMVHLERWDELAEILEEDDLGTEHEFLRLDLLNPWAGSPYGDEEAWRAAFGEIFTRHGYCAPDLAPIAGLPFDRLRAAPPRAVEDGPLVSVIMTTYCAEEDGLWTAVRSILDQTWRRVELLVVDDCSPEEHWPLLERVAASDPRVRLLRTERNGGTYLARNLALREARGELVTGQDSDDWCHPERIETQVRAMVEDPGIAGTRVVALRADELLRTSSPGYHPYSTGAITFSMYWRDQVLELGGFLPARKAADTELSLRLEAVTGKPVVNVGSGPLGAYRLRPGSLSRAEFRPRWSHPARRTFRDAYLRWHATAKDLRLRGEIPVHVPRRFQVHPEPWGELDVVWLADFRARAWSSGRVDELAALAAAGLRVGALHIDDPRYPGRYRDSLDGRLSDLVNAGLVTRIHPDEPYRSRLTLVRSDALLLSLQDEPLSLRSERLVVVPERLWWREEQPLEGLAVDARTAEQLLGRAPTWLAPSERAASALRAAGLPVEAAVLPPTLDPSRWTYHRRGPVRDRPVLGLVSPGARAPWSRALARGDRRSWSRLDVRALGPAERDLSRPTLPHPDVLLLELGEISLRAFLTGVDLVVHVPTEDDPTLDGGPVLEALAAGCVLLAAPGCLPDLGDLVVRAETSQLARVARRLHREPRLLAERSRRGARLVANRHRPARAVEAVLSILEG